MKKLLLAFAFLLAPSASWAQCTGIFPPNTLCGNLSGVPAPPAAFSSAGGTFGPGSSVIGDIATWNNVGGTLLADSGLPISKVAPMVATNAVLTASPTTAYPGGVWRIDFSTGLGAPPLFYLPSGSACSLNAGNGDNGSQVKSSDSKCWLAKFPGPIDVRQFGADPSGVADSAPAARAMFALGSNQTYVFPPGAYNFATSSTSHPFGCGTCIVEILIDSMSNFAIYGYGASININASLNGQTAFEIDRSSNFFVAGLKVNQNGFVSCCNPAFGMVSNVGFHITDISFGSGLNYQAFVGDWWVNAVIDHINMVHGQCLDIAYVLHVKFDDFNADGANTTAAGLCLGINTDIVNNGLNNTGYSFTQTQDVTITRFNISNYNTGIKLTSGKDFKLANNTYHDMPGPSVAPTGIVVGYNAAGNASSVGVPVAGLQITNDVCYTMGATTPGNCILVDTSNISNADKLANITINGLLVDNVTFCGICSNGASWATHISNFVLGAGISFTPTEPSLSIDSVIQSAAGLLTTAGGNTVGYSKPVIVDPIIGATGHTIAGLPTCNAAASGMQTYVTNGQTTPPYLGAVSTTGAVVASVFCNGSAWVYN